MYFEAITKKDKLSRTIFCIFLASMVFLSNRLCKKVFGLNQYMQLNIIFINEFSIKFVIFDLSLGFMTKVGALENMWARKVFLDSSMSHKCVKV